MPTGSAPIVAATWLALLLMTGLLLYAGRPVLVPLALAVLIWQLINAVAEPGCTASNPAAARRGTGTSWCCGGRRGRRWRLWLVVDLIVRNVGAVSAQRRRCTRPISWRCCRGLSACSDCRRRRAWATWSDQIELDVLIRSISAALAGFVGSIGAGGAVRRVHAGRAGDLRPQDRRPVPDARAGATGRRTALGDIERRIERYLWIKTLMSVLTAFLSWLVLAADRLPEREFLGFDRVHGELHSVRRLP